MNMMATVAAAVSAFVVTSVLGIFFIPFLRRIKYGQTIKEIGPIWHKNKQGTPTMGGVLFIIGIAVAIVVGCAMISMGGGEEAGAINLAKVIASLLMALGFSLIGFMDDYIKVVKKRNLGLRARDKVVGQIIVSGLYLAALFLMGERSTSVWIPFFGGVDLGYFYFPFMLALIIGFVNAVNLTDGIDGLASSVTFVAALGFMVLSVFFHQPEFNVVAAAVAGGCLGFLTWNAHPAKVFMGDTGSLFLGGMVVALAFGIGLPMLLLLVGIIYLLEAGSVMLQVLCYKLTHKRIFKMSPIHHHFEMSGFSETKIVFVFSAIGVIGSIIAVIAVLTM